MHLYTTNLVNDMLPTTCYKNQNHPMNEYLHTTHNSILISIQIDKIYIYMTIHQKGIPTLYIAACYTKNTIFSAHSAPFSPRVRFVRWKFFWPPDLKNLCSRSPGRINQLLVAWGFSPMGRFPCRPHVWSKNPTVKQWQMTFVCFFWCPALPHSHHLYHWVL